jgi:hypothetical protein
MFPEVDKRMARTFGGRQKVVTGSQPPHPTALADPVRRAVLDLLRRESLAAGRAGEGRKKQLLREREVLDEYDLGWSWLRKSRVRMARGELDAGPPYIKIGPRKGTRGRGQIRYWRSSVEAWLDAHEVGGTK